MSTINRRDFLINVGTKFGVAGMALVASKMGLVSSAQAQVRGQDHLPVDTGRGRKVAVLGAGVSGLRAAWELAAGGFAVTVFEAAPYMGGRSQTIRPSSKVYRENWLRQPNQWNFPESAYHDTLIQEKRDIDGTVLSSSRQVCQFQDDAWEAGEVHGNPDEIYLNAGPGRIPSFHNALLDHCRKFNVALEPYIFASRQNLFQRDDFNDGEPAKLGVIKHSLRLELERILDSLDEEALSQTIGDTDMEAFKQMVEDFGGSGQDRVGYIPGKTPGSWFNNGTLNPAFDMHQILDGEAWTPGLFSDMRVYWQASLMQPTGGMDRIWANVLTKELPEGGTIEAMVKVNTPVTNIKMVDEQIHIHYQPNAQGEEQEEVFDFCISTMAPLQLSKVLENRPYVRELLSQVKYTAACKVGWQSKGRWFEDEYQIYGGISWIADTQAEDQTLINQIWYPSQDFHSRNAVLTGAYNSGDAAVWFGDLDHDQRLDKAVHGGGKLHGVSAADFKENMVYFGRGMSVAWADAPYQNGGWADHSFEHREAKVVIQGVEQTAKLWDELVSQPAEPLYLAGCYFSHTPGWQEGSIRTAMAAVYAIANKCSPTRAFNDGQGGNCRYEELFSASID